MNWNSISLTLVSAQAGFIDAFGEGVIEMVGQTEYEGRVRISNLTPSVSALVDRVMRSRDP